MTNFIFKSPSDLQKISQQIQVILTEQRKQRGDLAMILYKCDRLINNKNLQKQVDDFYSTAPQYEENVIHPEDEKDLD